MKNIFTHLRVLPVIATYYLIEQKVISVNNAEGMSMQPNIKTGDILIVDKFSFKYFNSLKKDDIIIAVQPVNPNVNICKRIIQKEGGQVLIGSTKIKVPEKHYWVEGDNKRQSYDSRHHGAVPQNLIIGRVIKIIHI